VLDLWPSEAKSHDKSPQRGIHILLIPFLLRENQVGKPPSAGFGQVISPPAGKDYRPCIPSLAPVEP